jgi:hypothetical protein
MEINYNMILKVLGTKKNETKFASLKNMIITADNFPSEF